MGHGVWTYNSAGEDMITRIKAMSDKSMEAILRSPQSIFENCCLISCVRTACELPDNVHWLRMSFLDVDSESDKTNQLIQAFPRLQRFEGGPGQILFNAYQANQIIDFILAHHAQPTSLTLYVNCALGVSRSGAVATVAMEITELDAGEFARDNPQIGPNRDVLRILRGVVHERKVAGADKRSE